MQQPAQPAAPTPATSLPPSDNVFWCDQVELLELVIAELDQVVASRTDPEAPDPVSIMVWAPAQP